MIEELKIVRLVCHRRRKKIALPPSPRKKNAMESDEQDEEQVLEIFLHDNRIQGMKTPPPVL